MKIFIIGTGNVATALGKAFLKAGFEITGIAGRNIEKVHKLSAKLGAKPFSEFAKIPASADIYIIAVKDDAISEVCRNLPDLRKTVVHTSGSTSSEVLSKFTSHGVFYPVETIRAGKTRSFGQVPICLESSDERTMQKLMTLAGSISEHVYVIDSQQRFTLHVAAVFANNFTNHLMLVAEKLLENEGMPSELVQKLAESTVKNAFEMGPEEAQTGPARRNDRKVILKHLQYLSFNKEYRDLYDLFSKMISGVYKQSKNP